MFVWHQSII